MSKKKKVNKKLLGIGPKGHRDPKLHQRVVETRPWRRGRSTEKRAAEQREAAANFERDDLDN